MQCKRCLTKDNNLTDDHLCLACDLKQEWEDSHPTTPSTPNARRQIIVEDYSGNKTVKMLQEMMAYNKTPIKA